MANHVGSYIKGRRASLDVSETVPARALHLVFDNRIYGLGLI